MKDNIEKKNEEKKYLYLVIGIITILLAVSGGTYAYFAFTSTNNNITGSAGTVNLQLTVTKVLPNTSTTDDILVTNFSELPSNLNAKCVSDEFATCQLYKINLANNSSGVSTKVSGSVSFNNTTVPNLSWIYLSSYSSSTSYTSTTLGSTFNTANSSFTNFVDNQLISSGTNKDFYLLVWVNESEEEQTDNGSYSGTIRFTDSNGNGVTSTFDS